MSDYLFVVEGFDNLGDIENLDDRVLRNIRRAVNRAAERARTRSDKAIREQIAFPARYLSQRLRLVQRASGNKLEAIIRGQDRPTSLARFASDRSVKAARKRGGVRVEVGSGNSKTLDRAFLIELKNGNLGLAVRTKGGKPEGAYRPKRLGSSNVWLLYGPGIDQVFKGVAGDESAETLDFMEREFFRLMGID